MNYIRYFWYSCAGFRTYINLLKVPLWSAIGFWALLSILVSSGIMGKTAMDVDQEYSGWLERSAKDLPAMRIDAGELKTEIQQPQYFSTNDIPILVDFAGAIQHPEKEFPDRLLILRQKKMEIWFKSGLLSEIPWDSVPSGEINHDYLAGLKEKMIESGFVILIVVWICIFSLGLVQTLCFSLFASFLERAMIPAFSFQQLMNLCLFALTPAWVLVTLYYVMDIRILDFQLIYLIVYCLFVVMASGASRIALIPPDSREDEGEK